MSTLEEQKKEPGAETSHLKSIKVMDKALIAFGGRPGKDWKFMAKDLSKNEHFTMVMRVLNPETLEVDLHATKEGPVREYEPITKVQMDVIEWKNLKEEQFTELMKSAVEKVDLGSPDSSFTEAVYVILPNLLRGEQLPRRAKLTEDSLKGLALNQEQMMHNQFVASGKEAALILRPRKRSMEFVFRSKGEMFILNVDRMMNGLSKLLGFDKVIEAMGEALKEREAKNEGGPRAT